MKLQLLHGPAIKASRIKLQQLRNNFNSDNVMVFEKGEDLQTILTNLQSTSLFNDSRLVILENPVEELIFDPLQVADNLSIVAWFDHQVNEKKPIMDFFKKQKAEILLFEEEREVSVFPFLDLLVSSDNRAFLELEKLKKAGFDIQYIITMIFYLLRNLAATPKNAPSFVRQKLEKQRRNFPEEKIAELYKNILEIDFKIKSGLLDTSQAEFLIIQKFGIITY